MTAIERFLSSTKDTDDSYIESLSIKRPTLLALAGEIEQLQHKLAIAVAALRGIEDIHEHFVKVYAVSKLAEIKAIGEEK